MKWKRITNIHEARKVLKYINPGKRHYTETRKTIDKRYPLPAYILGPAYDTEFEQELKRFGYKLEYQDGCFHPYLYKETTKL